MSNARHNRPDRLDGSIVEASLPKEIAVGSVHQPFCHGQIEEPSGLQDQRERLAALAHELGTPMNAIAGFADVLQGKGGVPLSSERQAEYLEIISRSASHVLELIDRIRQEETGISRELNFKPVDVADVVTTAAEIVRQASCRSSAQIQWEVEEDLPHLLADPSALRQILINLLSNAVKFSPSMAKVSLTVSRRGRKLVFKVKDNGIGMSSETIENLGQRHFRGNHQEARNIQGSGLGLSIVYELVQHLGGSIAVESTLGNGSCFTVELPLAGKDAHPVPADPEAGVVYLKNRKKIPGRKPLSLIRRTG